MTKTTNIQDKPDQAVINRATARLRQSRDDWEKEQFDSGFDVGVQWAADDAHYAELRNLQKLRDSLNNYPFHDWDLYFEDHDDAAYSVAEYVASAILYGHDAEVDRDAAKRLWPSIRVTDTPSGAWLKGFCCGALELFEGTET